MQLLIKQRKKLKSKSLSSYNKELIQRSTVISELKTTAFQSQSDVKQYLNKEVEKGNAEDVYPYYIVNGLAVTASKEVAEKIATFAEVEMVLPDTHYQLVDTEDATSEETEGQSEKTEDENQDIEWNVDRINAPDVWNMGFDGTGTVVANIDTGVQWDHPALKEKYAGYDSATGEVDHTYSFFDPVNGRTDPYDINGHGTHVMGTMVGSEPDGTNQVGVAPGAKCIAVQAFSSQGASSTDLLAAAEWSTAPGGDVTKTPDVVNNSWGGDPVEDNWLRETVNVWRALDIVPVFAAGNITMTNPGGPGSVANPSNYPESF